MFVSKVLSVASKRFYAQSQTSTRSFRSALYNPYFTIINQPQSSAISPSHNRYFKTLVYGFHSLCQPTNKVKNQASILPPTAFGTFQRLGSSSSSPENFTGKNINSICLIKEQQGAREQAKRGEDDKSRFTTSHSTFKRKVSPSEDDSAKVVVEEILTVRINRGGKGSRKKTKEKVVLEEEEEEDKTNAIAELICNVVSLLLAEWVLCVLGRALRLFMGWSLVLLAIGYLIKYLFY